VADIFRKYGAAYRAEHSLPLAELRVMRAIEVCRTATLGGHIEKCSHCDYTCQAYNSCRNRHCPKCQTMARIKWLESRKEELLPVEYFHVVFTLPERIAEIAFYNKEQVYNILFRAASETLLTIAADPQHLGAQIGFFGVLHTWGQNLQHHPHVHFVVPGGGISPDGEGWKSCLPGFFLPVKVLSRLFRRLFLEQLEKAFQQNKLCFPGSLEALRTASAFAACLAFQATCEWVVYAKPPFGGAQKALELSRPLHASRSDLQPEASVDRERRGHLPMEGLPQPRQTEIKDDDTRLRRVHRKHHMNPSGGEQIFAGEWGSEQIQTSRRAA
jgi:hypothetical protein